MQFDELLTRTFHEKFDNNSYMSDYKGVMIFGKNHSFTENLRSAESKFVSEFAFSKTKCIFR